VKFSRVLAGHFAIGPSQGLEFSFESTIQGKRAIKHLARHGFSLLTFLVLRKKQLQHHRLDRRCAVSSSLGVVQVPVR
jgi:predicted ABC-type ATPase